MPCPRVQTCLPARHALQLPQRNQTAEHCQLFVINAANNVPPPVRIAVSCAGAEAEGGRGEEEGAGEGAGGARARGCQAAAGAPRTLFSFFGLR